MTAAFDDRCIVRAQQSLASIAYSTQGGQALSRRQQRQRDRIVEAISVDTVVVDAISIAGSTSYRTGEKPAAIVQLWKNAARQQMVGSFIGSSLIWALFWRWVAPMLLEWAERWLIDQLKNNVSITKNAYPMQGRTSDR